MSRREKGKRGPHAAPGGRRSADAAPPRRNDGASNIDRPTPQSAGDMDETIRALDESNVAAADLTERSAIEPDSDRIRPLPPGLHLLSTPIGAARDLTLRGRDALETADLLIAEDTRTLRKLMEIHGVPLRGRPLYAYHDHNAEAARSSLIERLCSGISAVYASEAGTPMIADPGWKLARDAREAGIRVSALPGASAVITALLLSGMPTDCFSFLGFPPPKSAARRSFLTRWRNAPGALILYESPRRLAACLADMAIVFGSREAAIVREMTKRFEETRHGTLLDLAAALAAEPPPRGEIVVVVAPGAAASPDANAIDAALLEALQTESTRDAARTVAERLGVGRKEVYQRAVDVARSTNRRPD